MKRVQRFKELAGFGFVGRSATNEVAFKGSCVRIKDRDPSGYEIAEDFCHAVDMTRPGETQAVGIVESTLVFREPTRQRAVMENGPDIDTGVSSGLQDVRDVIDRVAVPVAGAGLES